MKDNNSKSYNSKQIESFHGWLKRSGYILTALCLMIGAGAILIARVSTNVAPQPGTKATGNAAYNTLGFHFCNDDLYADTGGAWSCYQAIRDWLGRTSNPSIPWLQVNIGVPDQPSGGPANAYGVFKSLIPRLPQNMNVIVSTSVAYNQDCGGQTGGSAACFMGVINGNYDSQYQYYVQMANEARAAGYTGQIIWSLAPEFTFNDPYNAQYAGNNPDLFKQAYRHVWNILKTVPNSKFSYIGFEGPTELNTVLHSAYPGDDAVDIIGLDAYDGGWLGGWSGIKALLDVTKDFAIERSNASGKAMQLGINEWGLFQPGDDPAYIQNMYDYFNALPATGAASLLYQSYFNVDNDSVRSLYLPGGTIRNPLSSAKFKQLFGGSPSSTPPPTPTATPIPTPTPLTTNKPDLVVTSVTWTPTSPKQGDAVTFKATVKNQGTAATPAGTVHGVSFDVNGTKVSWSDSSTSSLAVGASITLTANGGPTGSAIWSGAQGSYTVGADVDDVNRIPESVENNNTATATMVVAAPAAPPPPPTGQPDLVVTGISWTPASPETNSPITFIADVKNQGTAATPNNTIIGVSFSINGQIVSWSDSSTTSLAAGASRTLTANGGPSGAATWSSVAGSYTLSAMVDDTNRITNESNETNNSLTSPNALVVASAPVVTSTPPAPASALTATAVSSSQINLSWTASPTPNVTYDLYRTTGAAGSAASKLATVSGTSFGDTGLSATTIYGYYVITRDSLGVSSPPTSTVTATTQAPPIVASTPGTLTGTLKNSSGAVPRRAKVSIVINGSTKTYAPTSTGTYTISNLPPASYTVTYSAFKLQSQSFSIPITSGSTIVKNVILSK